MNLNIFRHKKKEERLNWIDKKIHKALKKKIQDLVTKRAQHKLGGIQLNVMMIDFNLLKYLIFHKKIGNKFKIISDQLLTETSGKKQYIHKINLQDRELLKASLKYKRPIEVMRLSIKTHSGDIFNSKIIQGTQTTVGNKAKIQEWIQNTSFKIKRSGHFISTIHIDHVHPTVEVLIFNNKGHISITNGLGEQDLFIANSLADHIPYPLTITAILPSGLKYSAIF